MIISFNLPLKGKQTVANKRKIDIDLPLFWGSSTIKYVVWCSDLLHNTDRRHFYDTLQLSHRDNQPLPFFNFLTLHSPEPK